MNIIYHISPSSVVENCTIKVYEPQIDGTLSEVRSIAKNAPHTSATTVTINGLDRVTHVVKLIGNTTSTVYHNYDVTPTDDTVTIFDPIFFAIGDGGANTPASGAVSYINTNLAGLTIDDLMIFRNGSILYPGINYDVRTGGGFDLIISGDVFGADDVCVVMRKPKAVSRPVNDSVVGKQFGATDLNPDMYVNVTSATSYTAAHLRKLIRLNGASAVYTFGNSEIPPAGYPFTITNFGASGVTSPLPKVVFSNAVLLYGGSNKTSVDIPFGQSCTFVFDGTYWNSVQSLPATNVYPTFSKGTFHIGDVTNGAQYTITIPTQSSTGYHVTTTLISNGNAYNDNSANCTVIGSSKTTTSFKIVVGEAASVLQDVSVNWLVVNF